MNIRSLLGNYPRALTIMEKMLEVVEENVKAKCIGYTDACDTFDMTLEDLFIGVMELYPRHEAAMLLTALVKNEEDNKSTYLVCSSYIIDRPEKCGKLTGKIFIPQFCIEEVLVWANKHPMMNEQQLGFLRDGNYDVISDYELNVELLEKAIDLDSQHHTIPSKRRVLKFIAAYLALKERGYKFTTLTESWQIRQSIS